MTPPADAPARYEMVDHVCMACGGRVLRHVSPAIVTPGGNHLYVCADCGKGGTALVRGGGICWCSFSHRGQTETAYRCVATRLVREVPQLLEGFRACGVDPDRVQVGIMLEDSYRRAMAERGKDGP